MKITGRYFNFDLPDINQLKYVEKEIFISGKRGKWHDLPFCQGVYFFSDGNEIVYVGESKNINMRLREHHRLKDNIKKIFFLPIKSSNKLERILVEKAYIIGLKPKYNKEIIGVMKDG